MTAEVVEGIAREIPADEPETERSRALTVIPQQSVQVGLAAVMALTDDQFEKNLELLKKGKERAKRLQLALLEEGTDYGKVPGIDRPFLHKPGAETFEKAYGLSTSYQVERKVGDGVQTPALEYIVHAKVHLGDTDGPVVGEGLGSCNTHESKYRFRRGERSCPECGKQTIIKGKADGKLKGKFWCASFKDGCGRSFDENDPRLVDQQVGQVENENPYDLANTILKMARKRAGVDGILTATGTSGLFTQDADSPAVHADATGSPASAAATGQGGGQERQASSTAAASSLPPMPKTGTISEPTSLGRIVIEEAKASLGKGLWDGQYRKEGDVPLGFVVHVGDTKIPQVIVPQPLAAAVQAAIADEPGYLEGRQVRLVGELFAVPWGKPDEDPKPPMRRLVVELIATDDWRVPARKADPAAATPSMSDGDDSEAEGAGAGLPDADEELMEALATGQIVPEEPAASSTAPAEGLTVAEFRAALTEHRIAANLASSVMKRDFKTDALGDLSPTERRQLLDTLLA